MGKIDHALRTMNRPGFDPERRTLTCRATADLHHVRTKHGASADSVKAGICCENSRKNMRRSNRVWGRQCEP